jgi:hypothetical protein
LEEILDALDIVDTIEDHDSEGEDTPQQEVMAVQATPTHQQAPK